MIDMVQELKEKSISGYFLTLIPYSKEFAPDVVRLRNNERTSYFLNQSFESTLLSQLEWTEEYNKKNNDLYWVIQSNETHEIIGSTSIYDIDSLQCEKGRFILDQSNAAKKPYALEAEILVIKLAFEELKVSQIITTTRYDNTKMESINKRFGFIRIGSKMIRNVEYYTYVLKKQKFDPKPFEKILLHWQKREEVNKNGG